MLVDSSHSEMIVALVVMIAITASLLMPGSRKLVRPSVLDTTADVIVMVAIATGFFLIADQAMGLVVSFLLNLG